MLFIKIKVQEFQFIFEQTLNSKHLKQDVREMKHTLGQKLAYLIDNIKVGKPNTWQQLSMSEKNQLQSLYQRLEEIKSSRDVANLFANIPELQCQTEKAYLQNNKDFFLALIFIGPQDNNFGKDCMRLSKHLNDCFNCFEIFCQVMRDFYYKSQELSQN